MVKGDQLMSGCGGTARQTAVPMTGRAQNKNSDCPNIKSAVVPPIKPPRAGLGREMIWKISVVIPYFQRDPGILRRALASIAKQSVRAEIDVIVVDDASPLPPQDEIDAAGVPNAIPVRVVKVANGGPGAARNVGIEIAISAGAHFIAFLDSDDEWLPDHLNDAMGALASGASFYFCDNRRVSDEIVDDAVTFEANWPGRRQISSITPISEEDGLYRMPPLIAFDEFLKAYLGQTSTVVYRASTHASARFSAALRGAGEDHMMWLQMARASTGVCFSVKANVVCGEGLNLYFSAFDWALPATRNRLGYLSLFYSMVMNQFPLTEVQTTLVKSRRTDTLSMFGYLSARQAAKLLFPPADLVKSLWCAAPVTMLQLPLFLARTLAMPAAKRLAWADAI